MSYNPSGRVARPGFSLIELLVVIAIIAVLVSLTTAAVQAVCASQQRSGTRNEILKLSDSLQAAMQRPHAKLTYLPSKIRLYANMSSYNSPKDNLDRRSKDALQQFFGRRLFEYGGAVNWGCADGAVLEGHECLVFWLGGIPTTVGGVKQCTGFSTDPLNPGKAGGERIGPSYDFKGTRLAASKSGMFYYLDMYGMPFVYLSTTGAENNYSPDGVSDCSSLGLSPYSFNSRYINPSSFQIISAGPDLQFGPGGTVWSPAAGSTDRPTKDNMTNFSQYILAMPQQ